MSGRLSLIFIILTVVIDAMGIGLIMPVMPDLIRELRGSDIASAALWGGALATVFAFMQFLFGPVIGNLSDSIGRRPVLLVSLIVMAADYFVMAVAGSIWLLLLGRIVGGITAATHATAAAYIADISAPEHTSRNFGYIGAAFGVGFILGPVLGGFLGTFGTRAPFLAAGCLALANAILGWFVLKETVTDAIRRTFNLHRSNPFSAFADIRRLSGLSALMAVYFLYQLANVVYPALWSYFTAEKFDWDAGMIGVSLGVYGLCFALVQGVLVAPAIKRFGETNTVLLGLVIEAIVLCLIGIVPNGWLLLCGIPLSALGTIGFPALQGIMSKRVADDNQGALQGVSTSLTSMASIIGPVALTQVFFFASRKDGWIYQPGLPFLMSSLMMAIAAWIFLRSQRPDPNQ